MVDRVPEAELLGGRYAIEKSIEGGAQAEAFLARDRQTGKPVFVKQIVVDRVEDWKSVELFERESHVLESLAHPAIPAFVEGFHEAMAGGGERFVLVQQYVQGENLEAIMASGERFTEEELIATADEILAILVAIHGEDPPLVHRDIKPSNIMRREDGRLVLVDFGTVKVVARAVTESTTVGTVGYTPFEQLAGQVRPASDQYALGATLIHLASRVHPGELAGEGMTLDFKQRVKLSEPFTHFVKTLVAARPEERFGSVEEARRALSNLDDWAWAADSAAVEGINEVSREVEDPRLGERVDESESVAGRWVIGIAIFGTLMLFIIGPMGVMAFAESDAVMEGGVCCVAIPLAVLIVTILALGRLE